MAQGNLSAGTGFSGPAFSPDLYKTDLLPKRIDTECREEDNRSGRSCWFCMDKAEGRGSPSISQRQTAKEDWAEGSLGTTQD